MPFQLSPGVIFTETDLTLIVPTIATTGGGMIGVFQWGPAKEVVMVTSERDLVEKFGTPAYNATYARNWFTAANFLKYGNNLKLVRHINDTAGQTHDLTASADGLGIANIYNKLTYLQNFAAAGDAGSNPFCAKYSGELGNSIKVYMIDHTSVLVGNMTDSTASDDYFDLIDNFDGIPETSVWGEQITGDNTLLDEIHILIVDANGAFTGVKGTVLEKFAYVSKAQNAKATDGTSNYYVDVINNSSSYIWWLEHDTTQLTSSGTAWGATVDATTTAFKLINSALYAGDGAVGENDRMVKYLLAGGKTGGITSGTTVVTVPDIAAAYSTHFENGEEVDVSLLIAGTMDADSARLVIDVADARKDCIAFVSPQPAAGVDSVSAFTLEDALTYRSELSISSSYGVMDSGYKLQYDNYNDRYLYVPLCADVAGCCVRTDTTTDPWYSPAGFNRGTIRNTVRLAYNPGKADRDELYKKGINPIVAFDGEGTVLFGDKTLLSRPSAFDRINVRRLFIVLEKAIATASKFLLFEFNDEFTRAQFKQLVEPYLREVQGRRGITDFRVVCDETNNTPFVIDSNGFVGDIYIKPNRSINFIQLNFIATPTGVSFEELGA